MCIALFPVVEVCAEQISKADDRVLWRFAFDNDLGRQSDDFFSAGWSFQRHSAGVDTWDDLNLSKPSRWLANRVPGIGERDGLLLRKGIGFGQIIQTPSELSESALIEDDVPYAGALGIANSWVAFNNDRLNAFQVYLGVLGPASYAEEMQKFIHNDLNMGTDPKGWDNQLENELLINLNYSIIRKIAQYGLNKKGFAADLSYSGDLGLGNLFTQAQLGLQSRFGWRLPEGFSEIPDVAGRGIIMDPILSGQTPGNKSQFYFSAAVRGTVVGYTVLLDGNTFEDSHSVQYDPYMAQLILGMHYIHGRIGLHLSGFYASNPAEDSVSSDISWGNFSLDYRF
jgi:hypothetical protein